MKPRRAPSQPRRRIDTLSSEQRSRCMAAVKGRDTTPELAVRRMVHGLGYRYRLHASDLPGKPDIVLRRWHAVIFVHGCFWHRHRCRFGQATPRTRAAFWRKKFERNIARDRRVRADLRRQGWRVLVVWECQLRDSERIARLLAGFLESC
ncbi:MAG: very short patch repair endonuclease [Phycisphaerales bacterium]